MRAKPEPSAATSQSNPCCFKLCPTCTIASMAGISSAPNSDNEYSTEGGEVGITWRRTTPRASSSRSRVVNTLAEIGGMSDRNSLKRRGPARRDQMTFGVQAPPMTAMHSVRGHASGGLGPLFCLCPSGITVCRYPNGNLKIGYFKKLRVKR